MQFREFEHLDENFACLFYSAPSSAEGLAEEGGIQETDWETWTISRKENLQAAETSHTASGFPVQLEGGRLEALYLNTSQPSCMISTELANKLFGSEKVTGKHILYQETPYTIKYIVPCEVPILFFSRNAVIQTEDSREELSAAIIRGMDDLNYHKMENLFQHSDTKIDVSLLKWMVYLAVFFCFLGILILFLIRCKRNTVPMRTYFLCPLLWLCYLRFGIFSDVTGFPTWALPGKWSDLDGWRTLGEQLFTQLSAISRFRDYPVLCNYYQGLTRCFFYLLLCLLTLFLCRTSD